MFFFTKIFDIPKIYCNFAKKFSGYPITQLNV